jgi:hypothetical protein
MVLYHKNQSKKGVMMLIKYIEPLIVANAIRTCWQSFDKSDYGGSKDMELIKRVGIKYKHQSTLEHCKIIIETDFLDGFLYTFFQENPYSNLHMEIISDNDKDEAKYTIVTNLRVLIENYKNNEHYFYDLIPEPYKYLVEGE